MRMIKSASSLSDRARGPTHVRTPRAAEPRLLVGNWGKFCGAVQQRDYKNRIWKCRRRSLKASVKKNIDHPWPSSGTLFYSTFVNMAEYTSGIWRHLGCSCTVIFLVPFILKSVNLLGLILILFYILIKYKYLLTHTYALPKGCQNVIPSFFVLSFSRTGFRSSPLSFSSPGYLLKKHKGLCLPLALPLFSLKPSGLLSSTSPWSCLLPLLSYLVTRAAVAQ